MVGLSKLADAEEAELDDELELTVPESTVVGLATNNPLLTREPRAVA